MNEFEHRTWGTYEVLLDSDLCKVKEIIVNPGQRLSYQYHNHRQEQWTITKGNLTIVLDDEKVFRKAGESISIPLGAKHRAWNETDEPVTFIEVQTGEFFYESDIVRLEDDYKRADEDPFEHLADGNYIGGLTMPKENTNKLNK